MTYRKIIAVAAATIALGGAASVVAAPKDTIAARQANFKLIGKSFKGINDEVRKPAGDINAVRGHANALAQAASKVGGHFPRGTGPEAGVKTSALPAIWQKQADFKGWTAKLVDASNKMNAAARSGNMAQVKAAIPGVGSTCKGCHDSFKAKD
ncbi:cytochrome c [Novosphingobium sp. TH158]|uniref:c-type cytochrome n=1 Tax=Novosphingobium sp. TH158 TaxID=2067455 RepID=UPI000C7B20A2|nr:cytochrome c [Novosphingobium sp. TH158]PLK26300.1 cytochrome C [Novosphingobium sp. TH158]